MMYTRQSLSTLTKDDLIQFVDSFMTENGRKYPMLGNMRKWHREEYVHVSKVQKGTIIDWILEYQTAHSDDPIEFKESAIEEKRLRRKTCQKLKELCAEKGMYFYGLAYQPKFVYVEELLGKGHRSCSLSKYQAWESTLNRRNS